MRTCVRACARVRAWGHVPRRAGPGGLLFEADRPPAGVELHDAVALGIADPVGEDGGSVPVGRLGQPDDVGAAVVYLASDEAAWLTAQTINLDGGSLPS